MMKAAGFLASVLVVSVVCSGQDMAEIVKGKAESPVPSRMIDPDAHVFGIAFGTSEAEVVERFGKPDGYIRLTGSETCMIYGKAIGFLFEDGKLHGVRIAQLIVDWGLWQRMAGNAVFDCLAWELTNGIRAETPLPDVRRILGDNLTLDEGKHHATYRTATATVRFDFSQRMGEGDSEDAYRVCAVTVERE